MPRPTNKKWLLEAAREEYQALQDLIAGLTPEEFCRPGAIGDWSAKDVLCHLTAWEQMALRWHYEGSQGRTPAIPAEGYNFGQTPQLNEKIYQDHRNDPPDEVLQRSRNSHAEIMVVIEALSEEQLFTPGHFAWTKKNTLGTYFVSATSSHYNWARTGIRKGLKAKRPA